MLIINKRLILFIGIYGYSLVSVGINKCTRLSTGVRWCVWAYRSFHGHIGLSIDNQGVFGSLGQYIISVAFLVIILVQIFVNVLLGGLSCEGNSPELESTYVFLLIYNVEKDQRQI